MEKIDFVITWVDDSDLEWRKDKAKYSKEEYVPAQMFRDWEILKYLFRGIEQNAPWVNNVFFVTCGQTPKWMNTQNPKLKLVNHKDYIPCEYLPTFSSRTIDLNFHRIQDLEEHFVYFNDDMFLLRKTRPEDFFKNGIPRMSGVNEPFGFNRKGGELEDSRGYYLAGIIGAGVLNEHFSKRDVIKRDILKWLNIRYGTGFIKNLLMLPWKYFSGFFEAHVPYSYLKSTYNEVWKAEPKLLDEACTHKIRTSLTVNHWLMNYWQLANGMFEPRPLNFGHYYSIKNGDNTELIKAIKKRKYKTICLNDGYKGDGYDKVKADIIEAFEGIFPEKSSFEK